MKNIYILLLVLCFAGLSLQAQDKWSLTYSIGFPSGKTSDFFSKTSWQGINLDYQHFVKKNLSIGFSAGWQVFDENQGYITETSGTQTFSGVRYNYLNSFPILFTGHYFFNPDNEFSPFVGLGVGLVHTVFTEDTGIFRRETTGWPFSIRPEIGFDYDINYGVGIRTSVRYNYVASGDSLPSFPYIALNLGLVWTN